MTSEVDPGGDNSEVGRQKVRPALHRDCRRPPAQMVGILVATLHSNMIDQVRVTCHAIERWLERVEPDIDPEEVEKRIATAWQTAEELCQAEGNTKAYLTEENVVLIVAPDGAIVTVFKPEYGFGPEIDARICAELRQQLKEARANLEQIRKEIGPRVQSLEATAVAVQAEIEALQAREKRIRSARNALLEMEQELEQKERSIAVRLYQSINYRLELLAKKGNRAS